MDEDTLRLEVAACCRLAEYLDLFDFSGHISAKIPGTDFILINSRTSIRSNIGPQDIIQVNWKDDDFGKGSLAPSEIHLHTVVYQRRPDVNAVAHLHSPAVIALSVTGKPIVPVIYRGYMFGEGVPFYDNSRTIASSSDGKALAETLGQRRAVIMRGHGSVVVADTLQALLYYSLSLELNARNQLSAYQAGVTPLPLLPEEIAEGNRHFGQKSFEKAWKYYVHKADLKF
jgi:L-ribulose-5-phosphate 4-epimerase